MPVDSKNNNNRNSFVEHSDISSRLTASSIITSEFSLACNTRTIDTWHFETTPKVHESHHIYIYIYIIRLLNKNWISENSWSVVLWTWRECDESGTPDCIRKNIGDTRVWFIPKARPIKQRHRGRTGNFTTRTIYTLHGAGLTTD